MRKIMVFIKKELFFYNEVILTNCDNFVRFTVYI